MEAHLDFLREHREQILSAGSLRPQPTDNPVGALWIVEAESVAGVEELCQVDPFWKNGLRRDIKVMHWSKAFEDKRGI